LRNAGGRNFDYRREARGGFTKEVESDSSPMRQFTIDMMCAGETSFGNSGMKMYSGWAKKILQGTWY